VVDLDAVRRSEDAAAGLDHPAQLSDRLRRIVCVLQNLRAEDEVEARVVDGEALDRRVEVGGRMAPIDTDVFARAGKERVVRLVAAADVEDALAVGVRGLGPKPRRQRSANGVGGGAA
jgi:DNA primase large subunit